MGLALSSIWEKARPGTGKGRWQEIRDSGLCSVRDETGAAQAAE
jgi:hypothetical protein